MQTDAEYERSALEAIAETFGFEELPNGQWWRCKRCGKRLALHFAGKALTSRIVEHGEIHLRNVTTGKEAMR